MKYLFIFLILGAGCRQQPVIGTIEARQLYELNKVAAQGTTERKALKDHIAWEWNQRMWLLKYRYSPGEVERYLDGRSVARFGARTPAWYTEHRRLKDSLLQAQGAEP